MISGKPAVGDNDGIAAVTALYDIGRSKLDGRGVDDYVGWLNGTLRLPIPFIIFLDPAVDPSRIQGKASDRIVVLPKEELRPFIWLERVEAICRDGTNISAKNDLTYRLPSYALIQFSKFDMIRQAAALNPLLEGLLWIDAGISRFFKDDLDLYQMNRALLRAKLDQAPLTVNITPVLRQALNGSTVSKKFAGTCERLVTGETFLVRASAAAEIQSNVYDYVEREWIGNDVWDNEQVALGELILNGYRNVVILDDTGQQAKFLTLSFPKVTFVERLIRLLPFRRGAA
ncbi:MAG: hypothetical protein P4M07_10965 [Xanthobacteraceae bacterium]|nr:hypothetical protein [Xanthobacteraceae bacterium]